VANALCYVYAYLRESTSEHGDAGSPYYVGKGKHGRGRYARAFDTRHNVHLPSDKSNIVILADHLTDNDARQAEMLLIATHGRVDLGTGCLRNRTDGGEGCEGRIDTEQTRKNRSRGQRGKKMPPWTEERKRQFSLRYLGEGNPFYGKTHTEESLNSAVAARAAHETWYENVKKAMQSRPPSSAETRAKISRANKGRRISEETRKRISAGNKGKVISPESREKMRAAKLGKPLSMEHVEKVRKAVASSWARRKQQKLKEVFA
jgi:hypothetical protein